MREGRKMKKIAKEREKEEMNAAKKMKKQEGIEK